MSNTYFNFQVWFYKIKIVRLNISAMNSDSNSVPAFYEGRSVFITGATGFVGKVSMQILKSESMTLCLNDKTLN